MVASVNHLVSASQHHSVYGAASTCGVNDERLIRLENLKRICSERSLGPHELKAKLGSTVVFWRDLLKGDKSFGEKLARRIEEGLENVPRGWLDVSHGPEALPQFATGTGKTSSAIKAIQQVFEITETDWGHLAEFKDMSDDDIAFIREETHKRHLAYKKLREEVLARAGIRIGVAQAPGQALPLSPRAPHGQGSVQVKVTAGPAAAPKPRQSSRLIAKDKSPLTVGTGRHGDKK
jgi:hypothetical protein